jgi:hypothetical protein
MNPTSHSRMSRVGRIVTGEVAGFDPNLFHTLGIVQKDLQGRATAITKFFYSQGLQTYINSSVLNRFKQIYFLGTLM